MTQPKSIITNKTLIEQNTTSINNIQSNINDIRLGVAIKDEYESLKYTGYTDWRLKLEIYSNIDINNSNVFNQNLLFNNNNKLVNVDYIHLLANNEIKVLSNIEIENYCNLTSSNLIKRTYQANTYQDYIYSKRNDRLLLRFTLNILLKEPISTIDFIPSSCNLPPYSYFIDYYHKGTNYSANIINPIYTNFHKGWNTIDWFFIYDKTNYPNTSITLGFNPLLNQNITYKTELITGFLAYNPTSTLKNTKSLNYEISDENDQKKEFIIKQEYAPIEEYKLTKTFTFYFNNINTNNFNSNLIFNTDLKFDSGFLKFNSITLTNNNNIIPLDINNLKFTIDTNNIINNIHSQLIKDKYTFNINQFTSNLDIKINGNSEFNSNLLKTSNIKPFNINFTTSDNTPNYNIKLEFYLEIRNTENNANLVFTHKEQNEQTEITNNKIIFMNDGSIGIGTNDSQNYSLYVNNINSIKKGIYCADDITILSDAKFKTNIKTIENPIEKIMALRGVSYNRIDRDINENRFGFIAQEVQKVLPEACDGDKGIKTTDIVALLVEAVKELAKNVK
jgi:hypothetical protein